MFLAFGKFRLAPLLPEWPCTLSRGRGGSEQCQNFLKIFSCRQHHRAVFTLTLSCAVLTHHSTALLLPREPAFAATSRDSYGSQSALKEMQCIINMYFIIMLPSGIWLCFDRYKCTDVSEVATSTCNFYCCTVHFDNIKILFTNKCTPLLHIQNVKIYS